MGQQNHELYAKVLDKMGFVPEDVKTVMLAFTHVDTLSGLLRKDQKDLTVEQEDLAVEAAVTLARDDPRQENLGRTAEGQAAIHLLVKTLHEDGHLSK